MADDETVAAARETPVGDQRNVLAHALAHDRAGRAQHFSHAGPANRSFMADHDNIPLDDGTVQDGRERRLLRLEHARVPGKAQPFLARNFRHCAGRRQVAVKHDQVAVLLDRVVQRAHDILPFRVGLNVGQVFRHGLAGHGHAFAVKQSRIQQGFHQRLNAADRDQLRHQVSAAGFYVRHHRNASADAGKIIQLQLDPGGMSHSKQMQHRVGGAAERDNNRNRVLECFTGHDVARLDITLDQFEHGFACAMAVILLGIGNGFLCRTVRQAHAERLDRRRHRVRGIHAAAGAGTRYRGQLDLVKLVIADLAGRVAADCLEHGNDIPALGARLDRAAVNEDAWTVEPRQGHHAARHVLVAAANGNQAVKALCTGHGLDRIGDHFARHQRIAHPRGPHRNTVRNRDGIENHALAPGAVDTLAGILGQLVDVHVAGRHHAPCGCNADLGLVEILVGETDRVQHRAARGLRHTVYNYGRKFACIVVCHRKLPG